MNTQVIDNQETLRKQLEHGMRIQKPTDRFESDCELAHGRIEKRIYKFFEVICEDPDVPHGPDN